jgi:predicted TIM-barrel fold metal-dependent hydrolase
VTPLPGLGDWNALELLQAYPDIMVFSSDYPHTEGNADPINLYRPALDDLPGNLREAFLGENMAECFARTGDPVV